MPSDTTSFLEILLNPEQWTVVNVIAALAGIAAIAGFLFSVIRALKRKRKKSSAEKTFGLELYKAEDIERYTSFYIQPYCCSIDPTREAEIHNVVATEQKLFEVVDKFLDRNPTHHHLILLADSGMGKSSFVLNYHLYNREKPASERHRIAIVPLGIPDPDRHIANIPDKPNTIIFLDAFDEDTKAIDQYRDRLIDLMRQCYEFKRVLITCRTQFFLKDEEIPKEPGTIRVSPASLGETKSYEFKKLYLSPFSKEQIDEYLQKRFSRWRSSKREKASEIVETISPLSVRPMLLTYIPDLLESGKEIRYSFQLYEIMVRMWLDREKRWVNPEAMRLVSENLAVYLYLNRKERGGEFIPHEEMQKIIEKSEALKVPLKKWQLTGRSLLNRDGAGNYKFAHRSIMEYLFIYQFAEGNPACRGVEWTDQMKLFLIEMIKESRERTGKLPFSLEGADLSNLRGVPGLPIYRLRSKARRLNENSVKAMLKEHGFFASDWNKEGNGVLHLYESRGKQKDKIVIDHATGLTWEQSGSPDTMDYNNARQYIEQLNREQFAGFNDWRLPTLEEAMSLMEPEKKNADLYIDPVFDKKQRWIWTADEKSASVAWVVDFDFGICGNVDVRGYDFYVRAVRFGH